MSLWSGDDCAAWEDAIREYPSVILAQNVNRLEELDTWYREELPGLIAARRPPYVTHRELEQVTVWKMKRGVWRERNRLLVLGNTPAEVKGASKEAFALLPDPRRPIAVLTRLQGVGPATASGVLAALSPDIFPFFDELVAMQIPKLGRVSFTAPYYQRYAAKLRERAAELGELCPQSAWTAQRASQALWAASGGKIAQAKE